jgi:hypothetical protein
VDVLVYTKTHCVELSAAPFLEVERHKSVSFALPMKIFPVLDPQETEVMLLV